MRRTALIVVAILAAAPGFGRFSAQAPAFDVASIKPSLATADSAIQANPNGHLTVTNTSLRALILRAYGLHESQLLAAPEWIATERFDVDARVEMPPRNGPNALMPLLQALLTDRFRLRTHSEMRDLPAYVLMFARRDRRLGPQIRPTLADCSGTSPPTVAEIRAQARDGWPPCGMAFMVSFVDSSGAGLKTRLRRSAIAMKDFATTLQTNVDRPVVDRTGLDGLFDVEYSFAQPGSSAVADANQPLFLVALEEQLGLKLDAQRTTVPVLVIDSVDRLIEN
jgi:uncharacterized protein (TIGR03435 family)